VSAGASRPVRRAVGWHVRASVCLSVRPSVSMSAVGLGAAFSVFLSDQNIRAHCWSFACLMLVLVLMSADVPS
jgi:hypothetical protein